MLSKRDANIIKAIKTGEDQQAIAALCKSLLPKIRKIIGAYTEAEEEAKDILHDALLSFYKQVINNAFDEKQEVEGYIYSIAKNTWLNKLKRNQRIESTVPWELPEPDYDADNEHDFETVDKKTFIKRLFSKLEEKCEKLLTYTIFQDLSYEDIVLRMGFTSENAARTAHFRCKKHLMNLVAENKQILEKLRN